VNGLSHEMTAGQPATGARAARFAKGEPFAAYMAHELRTPLATQRALLELALSDPRADVASWREIGEDVLGACRQQERVLDACLSLARSQHGPKRREPVDVAAIAAEALRTQDAGGLECVVALEPAWTTGDSDLLERLAVNLVSNAIRHNIAGGRIEVATGGGTRRAHFTVANTGPLVPAAELQRLFRPFQRLAYRRTDGTEGVGLGLAVVHAVAEAHRADLTAHALESGGMRIDVTFPARRRPSPRRARQDCATITGAPTGSQL
jgi:signal transduction histidine kinase